MRLTELTDFRLGVACSFITTIGLMITGLPTSYVGVVLAGVVVWLLGELIR